MRLLIICLMLLSVRLIYADTVLYRYTDKVTGEERGICYSGKDGNPAIINSNWNAEIILEEDKDYYTNLQKQQMLTKSQANKALVDKEKATVRIKLKTSGLTDKEIDTLLGETKNIIPIGVIE